MLKKGWLTRRSVSILLAVALVAIGIYALARRQLGADTIVSSASIVGLADTHVVRMGNHGIKGEAVLTFAYTIRDDNANPLTLPNQVINWGDGTGLDYANYLTESSIDHPVSFLKHAGFNTGLYALRVGHTYKSTGIYKASIQSYNASGQMTSQAFTVIVMDEPDTGSVNYPPSISAQTVDVLFTNQPYSTVLLTDDYNELGKTRLIAADWADGTAGHQQLVPINAQDVSRTTVTHTYTTAGEYLASFTAIDEAGRSTTIKRLFLVKDSADVTPLLFSDDGYRTATALPQNTISDRIVAVDLAGRDMSATLEQIANTGAAKGTASVTPTQYYKNENYYDQDSRVRYYNARVAEYQPTLVVGALAMPELDTWRLKVENASGLSAEVSRPITQINKGRIEFTSSFTDTSNNCSQLDWTQFGDQRYEVYPEYNPYLSHRFTFTYSNCHLKSFLIRSDHRSTLSHIFRNDGKYQYGPNTDNATQLVGEFDLEVFSDSKAKGYIGFANSTKPDRLPEFGLYIWTGDTDEDRAYGSLYQLDADGKPLVLKDLLATFEQGKKYRVTLLAAYNIIDGKVREYNSFVGEYSDGRIPTAVGISQRAEIDSFRISDDGTEQLGNKIVGNLELTIDNVIVTGYMKDYPVTPPVTPVEPPTTPMPTPTPSTETTSAPQTETPTEAPISARQQLINAAVKKSTERLEEQRIKLVNLRQELAVAQEAYRQAVASRNIKNIIAAKREVYRLNRAISSANSSLRSLTNRARLVSYSDARIIQLEAANVRLRQEYAALQEQLVSARQQYAQRRTVSGYYKIRRLATRSRAVLWRIGYNERLVIFHENRLKRESQ